MPESRRSFRRLVGAIATTTALCAAIGACSSQKHVAQVSESGWGAGDKIGRQLFDSKLRAQRGEKPISRTIADAQVSDSDR